jgi:hypothetical protein
MLKVILIFFTFITVTGYAADVCPNAITIDEEIEDYIDEITSVVDQLLDKESIYSPADCFLEIKNSHYVYNSVNENQEDLSFSDKEIVSLCAGTKGKIKNDCLMANLSSEEVDLFALYKEMSGRCTSASTRRCVELTSLYGGFEKADIIELCSPKNSFRSLCAQAFIDEQPKNTKLPAKELLNLCSSFIVSSEGYKSVLECFALSKKNIPNISDAMRVQLCKNSTNIKTVDCFIESTDTQLNPQNVIDLCQGSNGLAPLKCYANAKFKLSNLKMQEIINLCQGSFHEEGAIDCFSRFPQTHEAREEILRLCRGSSSDLPFECLSNMDLEYGQSSRNQLISFCSSFGGLKKDTEGLNKERVESHIKCVSDITARSSTITSKEDLLPLAMRFCRSGQLDNKIDCFEDQQGITSSQKNAINICSAADPLALSECIGDVDPTLSVEKAIRLCAGANNNTPIPAAVDCYNDSFFVSKENKLALCSFASNQRPLKCYDYANTKLSLDKPKAIQLCARQENFDSLACYENIAFNGFDYEKVALSICSQSNDPRKIICVEEASRFGMPWEDHEAEKVLNHIITLCSDSRENFF